MRKLIAITAGAVALLGSTVAALATEDTGTIIQISWGIGTITLDNGHTYIVPPSVQKDISFAIGDKVKVTEEDKKVTALTKVN